MANAGAEQVGPQMVNVGDEKMGKIVYLGTKWD